MSYKFLEHATDAIIEVTATNLDEAFIQAGLAVVDTTLDIKSVEVKEERSIAVSGSTIDYLLFDWLEAIIYQLITEGFAISRFSLKITKGDEYTLEAIVYGEPIDLKKHHFKVEIKAPTFHEMEIKQNGVITMKFLLDL